MTFDPGTIAIAMLVSQLVGKVIPDNATGIFGIIRMIAKVTGLYIQNKE